MAKLILRLDMRAPAFANTPDNAYQIAVDMAEWADQNGFAEIMLSEHHGADDGYLPSPLVLGGAIAARTKRVRIRVSALILPLHDPLRIAEDVAVLDRLSGGRAELVIAGGFRPSEFAMFGQSLKDRGRLIEEGIDILKKAWTGKPFDYRGTTMQVTPTPLQQPHPPLFLGGSTKVAARRAARIADGFIPAVPELYPVYLEECRKLNVQPPAIGPAGPAAVFVAENPDAYWQQIAPYALHETNSYAKWYAETGTAGPYQPIQNADTLRASGIYQVLRPHEFIKLAETLGADGMLFVQPLLGGLNPQIAWECLHLLERDVLPKPG